MVSDSFIETKLPGNIDDSVSFLRLEIGTSSLMQLSDL